MTTLSIYYQTHFEISFSNTFNTFRILYIFHVVVMGKLDLWNYCNSQPKLLDGSRGGGMEKHKTYGKVILLVNSGRFLGFTWRNVFT